MSEPAILKLSSIAAKYLYEKSYNFSYQIDWFTSHNHQELNKYLKPSSKRKVIFVDKNNQSHYH